MRNAETSALSRRERPTAPTRPMEEIARLGREMYKRDILPLVEADHHGEVVAIDVDTGDWAVGDNVIAATDHLREKRPESINVLSERVGYPALRQFGGISVRWSK